MDVMNTAVRYLWAAVTVAAALLVAVKVPVMVKNVIVPMMSHEILEVLYWRCSVAPASGRGKGSRVFKGGVEMAMVDSIIFRGNGDGSREEKDACWERSDCVRSGGGGEGGEGRVDEGWVGDRILDEGRG